MKRFLLSLVALVITSVCFAQDIIVQKDGSTIQAKVLKVTQSEVEYKKFSNQNGPTYTVSTKDLQCINYENGTKDTFVSPNYNPNILTNETATQFSNDQQLLKMYNGGRNYLKTAKTLKTIGWITAGTGALLAIISIAIGPQDGPNYHTNDYVIGQNIGLGLTAAGTVIYIVGLCKQQKAKKESLYSVQSAPIYQQEFKVGKNDRLMVGVDMLKDNTRRNQTLGLGASYNF